MSERTTTPARQRRLPPILIALAMQALAALMVVLAAYLLPAGALSVGALGIALIVGVLAAGMGRLAGLAPWWLVIQLVFAPAIVLASGLAIPRWLLATVMVVLILVYWSTFRTQVPLYLSSTKVRQTLIPLLPPGPFTFLDVGSGVGGVLVDLAAARPDGEYHGVESAPFPWLVSRLRTLMPGRRNCHAHWGSFWKSDLSRYDVVFAYLSPVPMAALWAKVRDEMRPGSVFISNTFAVDAVTPDREIQVDDLHRSTLYIWTRR